MSVRQSQEEACGEVGWGMNNARGSGSGIVDGAWVASRGWQALCPAIPPLIDALLLPLKRMRTAVHARCMRTHTHTRARTHTHTYTRTHSHAHEHTRPPVCAFAAAGSHRGLHSRVIVTELVVCQGDAIPAPSPLSPDSNKLLLCRLAPKHIADYPSLKVRTAFLAADGSAA